MESAGSGQCKKDAAKTKVKKVANLKQLTEEECRQACEVEADCYAASFRTSNGKCKLFSCGGGACELPMKSSRSKKWECFVKLS